MFRRLTLTIICTISLALLYPLQPVQAQAGSADDLIAEVNALRQSKGLAPYTIDTYLMDFAQSQSNYMATLGSWTHTRADGSTAFQYGIQENVAMGTNMSVSYCVYTAWSDYVHWKTMIEYATGSVGAGVAFSGENVFYTLNVRPGDSLEPDLQVSLVENDTPEPYVNEIITSTPNADGIVIHYVKYGESLWSIAIAYGTTGAEIMTNSGNNPSATDVYEGQMLIIRTANPKTPTLPATATPIPPTRTNTPLRPTRTPLPSLTPGPTATPTHQPPLLYRTFSDGRTVAISLISVSGVGLLLVLFLSFIKKPKN